MPSIRRTATRTGSLAAAALLAGCSATASAPQTGIPQSTGSADLRAFLPSVELVEDRVAADLDAEESTDLGPLWEGMSPKELHLDATRTRFYRDGSGAAGGYVGLSLFDSVADAETFLATNPSYDPDQEPNTGGFGRLVRFGDVADGGHGWTFEEDGGEVFGGAVLRMDRLVVDIAVFGQPAEEYPSDLTALAEAVREAVDDAS